MITFGDEVEHDELTHGLNLMIAEGINIYAVDAGAFIRIKYLLSMYAPQNLKDEWMECGSVEYLGLQITPIMNG